jgi:beta-galactosidase/beta-glucuronidase
LTGYARTATEGELVAETPDIWDFLIDPTNAGESLEWFRDGPMGGNWQLLRTKTASWSDQGLHYYKGLAWYRTEVFIPERFRGRRIFLWFGGIDEHAKVWLNGRFLGSSDQPGRGLPPMSGVFKPFDLDATDAVRFGESNYLAVKITNTRLNELGTGGIVAPAFLWSPKDPRKTEEILSAP